MFVFQPRLNLNSLIWEFLSLYLFFFVCFFFAPAAASRFQQKSSRPDYRLLPPRRLAKDGLTRRWGERDAPGPARCLLTRKYHGGDWREERRARSEWELHQAGVPSGTPRGSRPAAAAARQSIRRNIFQRRPSKRFAVRRAELATSERARLPSKVESLACKKTHIHPQHFLEEIQNVSVDLWYLFLVQSKV